VLRRGTIYDFCFFSCILPHSFGIYLLTTYFNETGVRTNHIIPNRIWMDGGGACTHNFTSSIYPARLARPCGHSRSINHFGGNKVRFVVSLIT
jgi:hypothetical protein